MIIHPTNIIAGHFGPTTCRLITDHHLTHIGDTVIRDGITYRIHAVKETDNAACPWMQAGTYIEAKGKRL